MFMFRECRTNNNNGGRVAFQPSPLRVLSNNPHTPDFHVQPLFDRIKFGDLSSLLI